MSLVDFRRSISGMTTSESSTTSPAPSILLIWEEDQVSTKLYVIPESKLSQEDLKVLEDAHGHLEPGDPKEGLTEADITPLKALLENFTGFILDNADGPIVGTNITKVFMSGFIPAVSAPKYMVSNISWSAKQEREHERKELDEKCELHLKHLKEIRELDAKHEAERTAIETAIEKAMALPMPVEPPSTGHGFVQEPPPVK